MYKVLLDENLPVKIKYRLQDSCEIYTVSDKNWNSFENGNLIRTMEKDEFDFLITSDKNLQYQQNIANYRISFIILDIPDNNYETILLLVEKIKEILKNKARIKLVTIKF